MPLAATTVTAFVLAGNTLLRPLINWMNRRPIDEDTTEAVYSVLAVCDRDHVSDVRDLLAETLTAASYPIRDIETESENEDRVELSAVLVATAADGVELDDVVQSLEASPLIRSATWSVGTAG